MSQHDVGTYVTHPVYNVLAMIQYKQIYFYLPPVTKGDYKTPSIHASICSSHFCINLNISFIFKDIFTEFAGNVYGYKNLSVQNFSLILKNKMAAIANCLKIIKVL